MTPRAYADKIADAYRDAWKALEITNDDFIRTTDADHEDTVRLMWKKLEAQGDIYLGSYEGWYCVPCEQYYTEKELGENHTCVIHKKPVEKVKEESYFFRLSKYQDRLLELYESVPGFIQPETRRNEVRAFVQGELRDFSVSRTTFEWGIAVPDRPGHVVYVWIDALTNYFSATRRPTLAGFWDDDVKIVHLIGKEISRFHAVYWPAMLMAAGMRVPDVIFCHGWWTVNGEKMSKTAGNVVNPLDLAADIGVDAFRYFVLREIPLGADGDFSHTAFLARYNAELANDLGNLLNRTLGMADKYFSGKVPSVDTTELKIDCDMCATAVVEHMEQLNPSAALQAIWHLVRRCNAYIDQSAPWGADTQRRAVILWNLCEALKYLGNLLDPFVPERARELRRQLGHDEKAQWPGWSSSYAWTLPKGTPIFPRLDDDRKAELLAKWQPKPTAVPAPAKTEVPTLKVKPPAVAAAGEISYDDFQKLDLRVAKVLTAEAVPKAKKLLQLSVDLGAMGTRQVVAGIAERYQPAELVGKTVIFLANLAPATIRGVKSEGMILAAGDEAVVALSGLDADTPPGTKVR